MTDREGGGSSWLDDVRRKLLANADDLLSDADVLLANDRPPRAFALAQIASEEMAKVLMFQELEFRVALGHTEAASEIVKQLRSRRHPPKAELILLLDCAINEVLVESAAPGVGSKRNVDIRELARQCTRLRNLCLYVDVLADGEVSTPAEVVDRPHAEKAVRFARLRLDVCRQLGAADEREREEWPDVLRTELERTAAHPRGQDKPRDMP
jgi:AbiV family abortive infection protein